MAFSRCWAIILPTFGGLGIHHSGMGWRKFEWPTQWPEGVLRPWPSVVTDFGFRALGLPVVV